MADVISALTRKRAALVGQKHCIEREARERMKQIDKEIHDVDCALLVVNAAVKDFLCERCGGTGSVRVPDAAGQMEDRDCPDCKGTGIRMEAALAKEADNG